MGELILVLWIRTSKAAAAVLSLKPHRNQAVASIEAQYDALKACLEWKRDEVLKVLDQPSC